MFHKTVQAIYRVVQKYTCQKLNFYLIICHISQVEQQLYKTINLKNIVNAMTNLPIPTIFKSLLFFRGFRFHHYNLCLVHCSSKQYGRINTIPFPYVVSHYMTKTLQFLFLYFNTISAPCSNISLYRKHVATQHAQMQL